MPNQHFDLIASGGGLAGLMAAGRALELGCRALVLEGSADPKHLCASRVNGDSLRLACRRSERINPARRAVEV